MIAVDAYVVFVIVPVGMLERTTSVPFRYTTAPSSRLRLQRHRRATVAAFTVNWRRKYVVRYFVARVRTERHHRRLVAVAVAELRRRPAPTRCRRTPGARHAVPWFDPLSRYRHVEHRRAPASWSPLRPASAAPTPAAPAPTPGHRRLRPQPADVIAPRYSYRPYRPLWNTTTQNWAFLTPDLRRSRDKPAKIAPKSRSKWADTPTPADPEREAAGPKARRSRIWPRAPACVRASRSARCPSCTSRSTSPSGCSRRPCVAPTPRPCRRPRSCSARR